MTSPALRARDASTGYPLEGGINHLNELVNAICSLLQEETHPDLEAVLEDLAQLSTELKRLGHQVARLEAEREDLEALTQIGHLINSSLQLDDVLRIVMDTIVRLTGAERGFLMLRDKQGELSIRIARNWEQETLHASESAISRTVVNQVIAIGQPVLTTNAQQDPRFGTQDSVIAHSLRSILCVPLSIRERVIGVIYADNRFRSGLFTETERNLLAAFANQASVAIENAQLFESVRRTLAEVSELKNLMDDVLTSIASGVITLDQDGRITLCNQAAQYILGKARADLIGKRLQDLDLLKSTDLSAYLDRVRRTNQQIVGVEYNLEHPNQGSLVLSFNFSSLKNTDQTIQGVAIVVEDLTEKKRLESRQRLLSRMVSPAVVEQLDPDELQLGGKRMLITTLFADLRGFTSFSEQRDPEELVSILNRYLGAAAESVLAEGGTLDKFIGDAVMAFFNAPIPQADHALRAVYAALRMRQMTIAIQEALTPEFHLSFGTGIHTGEAILGLVGTHQRMDYTAIGDSVNIAKRLQQNAGVGQIMISQEVYEQIADQVITEPVSPIQAKGKKKPLQVYEVTRLKGELPARLI